MFPDVTTKINVYEMDGSKVDDAQLEVSNCLHFGEQLVVVKFRDRSFAVPADDLIRAVENAME